MDKADYMCSVCNTGYSWTRCIRGHTTGTQGPCTKKIATTVTCTTCNGKGYYYTTTPDTTIDCTICNGKGYYYTYSDCEHGYGYETSHYYCDKSGHGSYRGVSSLH